jgi:hypothetical protein
MLRLAVVVLPALGLVGAIFAIVVALPRYLDQQHFPATPPQPVAFSHQIHIEKAGLDCAYCHRTASTGVTAGYPMSSSALAVTSSWHRANGPPRSRRFGSPGSNRTGSIGPESTACPTTHAFHTRLTSRLASSAPTVTVMLPRWGR